MKTAERIFCVAASAYATATFIDLGVPFRGFYYGSVVIGAVAAIWMFLTWLRDRQGFRNGS
jgi:hypothetical protein